MEKLKEKAKQIKSAFASIAQRSLHNIIKNELIYNFGFENSLKIADAIAASMVEIYNNYTPAVETMRPYSILYSAIDVEEKPSYAKKIKDSRQRICVLRLYTEEEIKKLAAGRSLTDILPERIARIASEAYEQGCVLIQSDLMLLTGASASRIRNAIEKWEQENEGKMIPLRGVVHDIGTSLTHKKIIINYHIMGYLPTEIARLTNHNIENVDRYINDYERVLICLREKMEINRIKFFTGLSENLIKEYIEIIKESKLLDNEKKDDNFNTATDDKS